MVAAKTKRSPWVNITVRLHERDLKSLRVRAEQFGESIEHHAAIQLNASLCRSEIYSYAWTPKPLGSAPLTLAQLKSERLYGLPGAMFQPDGAPWPVRPEGPSTDLMVKGRIIERLEEIKRQLAEAAALPGVLDDLKAIISKAGL